MRRAERATCSQLVQGTEHAIDLETGAILGVTGQDAVEGDTITIQQTLPEAAEQLGLADYYSLRTQPATKPDLFFAAE